MSHLRVLSVWWLLVSALCAVTLHPATCMPPLRRVLGNATWTLTNRNRSIELETRLPAYALSVLQDAGVIGDPLYRYGELDYRWVALETWTFETRFAAPGQLLGSRQVYLLLGGVDTFADVYLNERRIARLQNFHRKWRLPVKPYLAAGVNVLSIVLHPAATVAARAKRRHAYPIPTMHVPGGLPVFNFARKPAADFGWDWGPAFAAAGVHGSVELAGCDQPWLAGLHIQQQATESATWVVSVEAELVVPCSRCGGTLLIEMPQLQASQRVEVDFASAGTAFLGASLEVNASKVDIWWPAGLGQQPLYRLTATFIPGDGQERTPCHGCSSVERRLGFRTLQLVREPLQQAARLLRAGAGGRGRGGGGGGGGGDEGESFFFAVNGVPLFVKGANLIPVRVLPTDVTPGALERTLGAALAAGMNMVRVWGGGAYPPDALYDWADRHGMLLWQEFMFACNPYPRSPAFLANVQQEAGQQLRRLAHHASIAVWGGNNEVEASLDWYNRTRTNPRLYAVDYNALFVQSLAQVVRQLAPTAIYLDSSPSNGLIGAAQGIKRWGDAQDPSYGDVHYYNYSADCQDVSHYPRAKFVSEFGWQSFPLWRTYASSISEEDWRVSADMTSFRQRHPNGTAQMLEQLGRHFHVPSDWNGGDAASSRGLLRSFLWLSHAQQQLCYEAAVQYWRRLRSDPQALTMGVLYWQLNDVWAGASWSSVDFSGAWKPLHYSIRRMYASFALQMVEVDGQVQVFVLNDGLQDLAVELTIKAYPLASSCGCSQPGAAARNHSSGRLGCARPSPWGATLSTLHLTSRVPPNSAVMVWHEDVDSLLETAALRPGQACDRTSCYLAATASAEPTDASWAGDVAAGAPACLEAEATLMLARIKELELEDPRIVVGGVAAISPPSRAAGGVVFDLTAQAAGLLVRLESDVAGVFSDNSFVMHACQQRSITFRGEEALDLQAFAAGLTIESVFDHQQFDHGEHPDAEGFWVRR